jgi:hypothetical protein
MDSTFLPCCVVSKFWLRKYIDDILDEAGTIYLPLHRFIYLVAYSDTGDVSRSTDIYSRPVLVLLSMHVL